ncbi:hypothetical protein BGW41_008124 [Actinomortierella wolfii]|nr:hypothetical protein BGW41_008124 [Actinomortierella wolfii]
MTASPTLASPALNQDAASTSASSARGNPVKAQTTTTTTTTASTIPVSKEQSHMSPVQSAESSSALTPTSQPQHHQIVYHTISAEQQQQQQQQEQQHSHHHLQILGNHPQSPVSCTFLELPADPFMPARANLLFPDQENNSVVYENDAFLHYPTPSPEDCQASAEYMYDMRLPVQRVKSEFVADHSALTSHIPTSAAAAAAAVNGGATYVLPMARSYSDGQLSDMSDNANGLTSFGSTVPNTGFQQAPGVQTTPFGYTYEEEYYMSQQHHFYTQQQQQHQHQQAQQQHAHPHSHAHSHSTSSLSALSEEPSLSPRSPFSATSLSNSCHSLATAFPLSRTLSEPSLPMFQPLMGANVNTPTVAATANPDATNIIKPTPKRSRGRRVSSNPDTLGCKVFTCRFEDCGKVFKRSEHLKRHVRSIHTLEKPFECPIQSCPKRFSRSDNLNQHIRIHRHSSRSDKNKTFAAFTPFLQNYSTDMLSVL